MRKRDHARRGIYMDPDETEKRDICPSEMFAEEKVMKVRVSILGASAVRDYDDETAIRLFQELSGRVLGLDESVRKPVLSELEKAAENVQKPVKMAPPPQSLKAIRDFFT